MKTTLDPQISTCLNCKFPVCLDKGCPVIQLQQKHRAIKISLLRDLLLAGYDPAETCFAAVEGTPLTL